ncbi:replication protein A, subunit RPA32 [Xylaria sp. FL1042]|nr:replication protein A, subunit RPA32 [Xylaria sp. FL1042]KAI0435374.1 replication protein A, subunit RPA32 [Xylaria sp. FL1042]
MSAYGGGYQTTSYGATGGDDGGGFMWGSQGGSQSAVKPINDESLRPVTIKQIIDAEPAYAGDASFRIDGLDVKQVTIVGMVRVINQQTTNITYRIDDGTGVIEVKQWLDADKQQDPSAPAVAFREADYVRVWGRLKSFSNKRHIGAHVIKPVRDFNEVNYHLLEATYVHLFFTRGGPPQQDGGAGMGGMGGGGGGGGDNNDSMFVDDGNDARYRGYSNKAKKMYDYLMRSGNPSEGIHMQVIAREAGMTIQDVMAGAEELSNHGTIYTTMDDETYAILDR